MEINKNTRLIDLTVEQLTSIIISAIKETEKTVVKELPKRLVVLILIYATSTTTSATLHTILAKL